eukprot:Opistho-2@13561
MSRSRAKQTTVKGRLQNAWNTFLVKIASTSVSLKSRSEALWLLGVCYRDGGDRGGSSSPVSSTSSSDVPRVGDDVSTRDSGVGGSLAGAPSPLSGSRVTHSSFRTDFCSRIWLSYRKNFSPISDSSLTTDCGWGCMIRAGQMLLAQCLSLSILGRDWRLTPGNTVATDASYQNYLQIVRWFNDEAGEGSPFSIHNVLETAVNVCGKKPGDWFGPCTVTGVLSRLLNDNAMRTPGLGQLRSFVALDHTIYRSSVREFCVDRLTSEWMPLVLFVPLRLGSHSFNKKYLPALKALLTIPQCAGLIGGCGSSGLYFLGFQGDALIYMDPHGCKAYAGEAADGNFNSKSFQARCPQKMRFCGLDPSMGSAFFCRDRESFDDLCDRLKEMTEVMERPILGVAEHAPDTSGCLDGSRTSICNGEDFVVL